MMPSMTNRLWNYCTVATVVASISVSAGAIALSAESSGFEPKDKKQVLASKGKKADTSIGTLKSSTKKVKPTTEAKRPTVKPKDRGRIALKPLDGMGERKPHTNPFLDPQKELVTTRSSGYQVDPLTGMGLMVSPDGVPVYLQLRPSNVSSAWVGRAVGDEWSTAFLIETSYGPVGMLQSRRWGNFRFLPLGEDQIRITSINQNEIGICGNGTEWEIPVPEFEAAIENGQMGGLASSVLAGGNCWSDTEDQTTDGISFWLDPTGAKPPDGQSYTVASSNNQCTGQRVLNEDTPDIPDWSIRDYQCTGFPVFDRVIDILWAYSGDALQDVGGLTEMNALAIAEIALLNETFDNSRMRTRARLVGVEMAMWADPDDGDGIEDDPYIGSSSPPADLNRFVMEFFPNTNGLTNVFEDLRDERGADIVTLMVSNNSTSVAGIAMDIPSWEGGGITGGSAAMAGCVSTLGASLSGTYQHEVGHLMGGCHGSPNAEIEGDDAGATCPCRTPETDECNLNPMVEPNAFPDEFHYGYRFFVEYEEVPPTEDEVMRTLMAYPDEEGIAQRVFHFSNPDVQVFQTNSDTGVIDEDGDCCIDDAENAANAFVMDYWIAGVAKSPDANFAAGAGIAQYRCRTIPYDCDQNGRMDTEELDGSHPDGNENGLVDIDGDRIADGCPGRPCLSSPAVDFTRPRLQGGGGVIPDIGVYESAAALPFGPDDSLAYQLIDIEIEGLVHPNFNQLQIALVHQQVNQEEDVFILADCNLGENDSKVLNGTYRFTIPSTSPAFDTLATPTLCQAAQGGWGWVPAGVYRPQQPMTDTNWADPDSDPPVRRTAIGTWSLRITDDGPGGTGFLSGWSMQMAYLPYDEDCDGDGLPDGCNENFSLLTDCNVNGLADSCEINADPLSLNDCDLNGRLDECEDTSFLIDCGGGLWDADGSGAVDLADNTFLNDNCPEWPLNGNCRPDLCDIRADPTLDNNGNFFIDSCEPDGGDPCANRVFDSTVAGLTGAGISSSDLGSVSSTITVPVADDDGTNVIAGAVVNGNIQVIINNLIHDNPNEISLALRHNMNGFLIEIPLLPSACGGTGYFTVPNQFSIRDGSGISLCTASRQGGPIAPGVYRAEGSLGAFVGTPASGDWTIVMTDIGLGSSGGFDSWDIQFGHRPPDDNSNGVPDVCEP